VRYAVAVPDDVYVARTVDAVRAMRAEGFRLAAAKARWSGPGYRGTNLTFLDPRTGRLFELQVHTPGSWSANVATHADYEIARDPTRSGAERSAASARIQALYDGVPSPAGAAELQSRLRWPGPDVDQYSVRPPLRTLPEVHVGALAGGAAGGASGTAVGTAPGTAVGTAPGGALGTAPGKAAGTVPSPPPSAPSSTLQTPPGLRRGADAR